VRGERGDLGLGIRGDLCRPAVPRPNATTRDSFRSAAESPADERGLRGGGGRGGVGSRDGWENGGDLEEAGRRCGNDGAAALQKEVGVLAQ
jgi:hypothetical protein